MHLKAISGLDQLQRACVNIYMTLGLEFISLVKDGVKNAERELGNGKQQKHYSNF